ncbi:hypothetical protein [Cognaticolwellia aestuarii]|nr:hypothetical protein [Cognaticolwellia aestuarii]
MNKLSFKQWWHTDCQFCRKARMIILWLILMLIADALWFGLIIH